VTFRDYRGVGGIFRMTPPQAVSAQQLGLSQEIQGLCAEAGGLVLVAGGRSSGKSTLVSAFVDLINRTRAVHVITVENQITFVHENRVSLVSQREVRGDRSEQLAIARAALRENPDVLVIEDFGSPEIVTLALEAAQSGHLVIGALTAHTATDAVDRIIDRTPPERRAKVQRGLAENLRGIVAQVLLRKSGSGRVAAREVLLNTSAVARLIAEGKTSQLPMAIESGRKHGMVALNDALVAFVQAGIVDSREAYRQATDQQGFLALLKRQDIDTSFVERLA
jgi:twitching motility protein PilT